MKRILAAILLAACLAFARPAAADQVIYYYTWTTNISSATTTLVFGPFPLAISVWMLGVQASGAETGTFYFETGTKTTNPCDTGTARMMPGTILLPATTQNVSVFFGGVNMANVPGSIVPASAPFLLPANTQICIVTTATAAGYALIWYSY